MLKDQLRKARKDAGKTQKDVANHLKITESTYCGYETGKRQPDALKIAKIAAFLNVTGNYLLEIEEADEKPPVDLVQVSPQQTRLVNLFLQLNEEGKEKLVEYADDLVSSGKYIKSDPSVVGQS